jgi:allophanate hydrolase subunit 2
VSPDSNRIGVRLVGSRPLTINGQEREAAGRARHGSYGMVAGALQIPPNGEPVVLLCDHATMGGYPVVATVISADIGVVAQRRPGENVQFEIVDLHEAVRALEALDRQVARAPTGIYPTGPVA